jgi:capsular exopolysaccharide synthesis family protein
MSRFYEALKEASRFENSRPVNTGGVAERTNPELDEFDFPVPVEALSKPDAPPGMDIPLPADMPPIPMPSAAEIAEASGSRGSSDFDPWQIFSEKVFPDLGHAARSTAVGAARTSVALDPKARVLPNTIDTAVVEHYRRLRTKLMQQHAAKPFNSLVVTSPSPQEGKSVTVFNLALSFAMLPSFKVLVIDGDIRRGTLGKWLGVGDRPGLSNLIDGSANLDDVVLKCDEIPIHFIVAGNSTSSPGELLQSPQLRPHFRRMGDFFPLVLVDSPPVNLITDAQLLAGSCDAVLLVARAFSTTRKSLDKAIQDLLPFRIIGTILNGGTRPQIYRSYNGYYQRNHD